MVYYFLLPRFVNFFVFDTDNAKPMLKIIDYVRTFFFLIFTTSLIFQFPIILLIFAKFGLVKKNILTKNRKIAILIIFIISAIITPPDVVSQIFIASIIILIYEITNYWLKQCIKK
jgi:sec-independent protein translocase protein TatC